MNQQETLEIKDILKLIQLENPAHYAEDFEGNAYDNEYLLSQLQDMCDNAHTSEDDYHLAMQLITIAALSVGWLLELNPDAVKKLSQDRYSDQSPFRKQKRSHGEQRAPKKTQSMNDSLFSELPNLCNCGSRAETEAFSGWNTSSWRCRVKCTECKRATLTYQTSQEAIAAWNRVNAEE
ncbi:MULTISPECIES: hypothetical protein [Leptospira]|uniref:hypothetical protein n=1 Tax=Leptospira TaxID=171 RepID=UPI00035E614A|nr:MULTISPECIES: hypothetical protein [Leptospira]